MSKFSSLPQAARSGSKSLLGSIARFYGNAAIKSTVLEESRENVEKLRLELMDNPIWQNPFFNSLLEKVKTEGMNTGQMHIIRDNFMTRTRNTIVSVASSIAQSVANGDFESIARTGQNFYEEAGSGNPDNVHLKLLEYSFNRHSEKVFGIQPTTIKDAPRSSLVLAGTINFGKIQQKIFRSSYPEMTGCLLAHELFADYMLEKIREGVFDSFKGYYTSDEYEKILKYFKEHHDDDKEGGNVEEEHAKAALEVSARVIAGVGGDKKAFGLLSKGAKANLDGQNILWEEVYKACEAAKDKGAIIMPKPNFKKEEFRVSLPTANIKVGSQSQLSESQTTKALSR